MNIQYIVLKPGSIIINKKYNWFKRLWAKLFKKVLPYNDFIIFGGPCDLVNTFSKKTEAFLIEPKKDYNKKEIKILLNVLDFKDDIAVSPKSSVSVQDLFTAINAIRVNTFPENTKDLQAFLNSKYYNIKPLADEKNWSEYIL